MPDFIAGLNSRFEYKGFDLSVFLFSRWGQMVYSQFHVGNNSLFGRYNNLNVDYWTPDNPNGRYPRPNGNQEFTRFNTTMGYFDGSFIKLRNVTLGYNLPPTVLEKIKMSNLRLYVSAQNSWFYAKYDAYDPETDREVNGGDVPTPKLLLFGVNASF